MGVRWWECSQTLTNKQYVTETLSPHFDIFQSNSETHGFKDSLEQRKKRNNKNHLQSMGMKAMKMWFTAQLVRTVTFWALMCPQSFMGCIGSFPYISAPGQIGCLCLIPLLPPQRLVVIHGNIVIRSPYEPIWGGVTVEQVTTAA